MRRVAYFDSSAIVKLVRHEPESLALVEYLETPVQATTSVISAVEVARTLRRTPADLEEISAALAGFFLVSLDSDVRAIATELTPKTLRSLDAIQLASAMSIHADELELITYDRRLAEAARANGVFVLQPGR